MAKQIYYQFFDFGNQVGFTTDQNGQPLPDGSRHYKAERVQLHPSASLSRDHELVEEIVAAINKVLQEEG